MTLLGVILLILGIIFAIKLLWVIGVILLVIGLVVFIASKTGSGRGNGLW